MKVNKNYMPEGGELQAGILLHEEGGSGCIVLPESVDVPHQQLQVGVAKGAAQRCADGHLKITKSV